MTADCYSVLPKAQIFALQDVLLGKLSDALVYVMQMHCKDKPVKFILSM